MRWAEDGWKAGLLDGLRREGAWLGRRMRWWVVGRWWSFARIQGFFYGFVLYRFIIGVIPLVLVHSCLELLGMGSQCCGDVLVHVEECCGIGPLRDPLQLRHVGRAVVLHLPMHVEREQLKLKCSHKGTPNRARDPYIAPVDTHRPTPPCPVASSGQTFIYFEAGNAPLLPSSPSIVGFVHVSLYSLVEDQAHHVSLLQLSGAQGRAQRHSESHGEGVSSAFWHGGGIGIGWACRMIYYYRLLISTSTRTGHHLPLLMSLKSHHCREGAGVQDWKPGDLSGPELLREVHPRRSS